MTGEGPIPHARHLTTRQLAARWQVSVRTLERWRSERHGPPWIVVRGSVRYAEVEIEAFEAEHRQAGDRP